MWMRLDSSTRRCLWICGRKQHRVRLCLNNLRDAVAWAAWMRALGLGDAAAAKRMSGLLPDAVRKTSGDSDGFPATLALLRNPGLRPYLEQGVQRSVTYAMLDDYRDNWWGSRWGDGDWRLERYGTDNLKAEPPGHTDFLTAQQQKQAANEDARLNALPVALCGWGNAPSRTLRRTPTTKTQRRLLRSPCGPHT